MKRGLELLRADLSRRRGSAAWSVFLVRAFDLAPPAVGRGPALVLRELAASITLMSTTTKLVAASAAVLVLAGILVLGSDPRDDSEASRVEPIRDAHALVPAEPIESEPSPADRRALEGAASTGELAQGPPSRTGDVVLDVVWAEDGSPAVGIAVRVRAMAPDVRAPEWETTSAEGRIELSGLEPGTILAQPLLGGLGIVEVVAGGTSTARIEIPIGVAVRGRVETHDGNVVPDADVFLSPGAAEPQYEGRVVARTDSRGEFAIRTAPAGVGACLSARAAGFAPSDQVLLTAPPRSSVELVIVLGEPGRSLQGVVLSPEGEPVAGASVLVGSERGWIPRRLGDGSPAWSAIGELVRTDAAGRFELRGVPLRKVPIQARASGHPVWRGEVGPDDPLPIVIRLERGAIVHGIVRDAGGATLSGIRVRVDPAHGFASRGTTSATDGSFRLAELPSGSLVLVAERPATGFQLGGAASASAALVLAPGAEHRWDPVLPVAREVRGRIEAPGQLLDGWTVRGWRDADASGAPSYVEEARTDDHGRFVLAQPPEGEIGLALFGRGGSAFPLARLEGVLVGGPEVVLRPDPALLPTCRIRGTLVDARGERIRSADVVASSATFGTTLVHPDAADGTFDLGALPAGEWTLQVDPLVAGWAVTRVARVLVPEETWDAGEVLLGPGGTLAVRLVGAPEADAFHAELLDSESRPADRLVFDSGAARSRPLAPGTYRLVLGGSFAVEPPDRSVVIVAGQETSIDVEIEQPRR